MSGVAIEDNDDYYDKVITRDPTKLIIALSVLLLLVVFVIYIVIKFNSRYYRIKYQILHSPNFKKLVKNVFKQQQLVNNNKLPDISLPFTINTQKFYTVATLTPEKFTDTVILLPGMLQTHLTPSVQFSAESLFKANFRVLVLIQPGILSPISKFQQIDHDFVQIQELVQVLEDNQNSFLLGFESGSRKIFEVLGRKDVKVKKVCMVNCPSDWLSFIPSYIDVDWNRKQGKQLKEYYLRNQEFFNKQCNHQKLEQFLEKPSFTGFDECFWRELYEQDNLESFYQNILSQKELENIQVDTLMLNSYSQPYISTLIERDEFMANEFINYMLLSKGEFNAINSFNEDLFMVLAILWFTMSQTDEEQN